MAKVTNIYIDSDSLVRIAEILMPKGLYKRPVQELVVLLLAHESSSIVVLLGGVYLRTIEAFGYY